MNGIQPVVRSLTLCDDIVAAPGNPRRLSLLGVVSSIQSLDDPPYPFVHRMLCAFVQLTGCRGTGTLRIEITRADSGQVTGRSPDYPVTFPNDPLAVVGISFRLLACRFPEPGLYWVSLWYNDTLLAQQPLLLR